MPNAAPVKGMRVQYGESSSDTGRIREVTEFGGFEVRFADGESVDYSAESWEEFTILPPATSRTAVRIVDAGA
jgi:hypothetical protein